MLLSVSATLNIQSNHAYFCLEPISCFPLYLEFNLNLVQIPPTALFSNNFEKILKYNNLLIFTIHNFNE